MLAYPALAGLEPAGAVAFGLRGNTEIPLHDLTRRGLGLTGQGAVGTARALLVGLLTARGPGQAVPQVIIPQADAQQLIPEHLAAGSTGQPAAPSNLIIADTLAGALDHFEAEITHQLRVQQDLGTDSPGDAPAPFAGPGQPATVALIARPDRAWARRLQAAVEAGRAAEAMVVVLGPWDTGVTCAIGTDGVVAAASRTELAGLQTFHLHSQDTATLLSLLNGAHGRVTDDRSGDPIVIGAEHAEPGGNLAVSAAGDHGSPVPRYAHWTLDRIGLRGADERLMRHGEPFIDVDGIERVSGQLVIPPGVRS